MRSFVISILILLGAFEASNRGKSDAPVPVKVNLIQLHDGWLRIGLD